jgi:hypothetical protein
MQLEVSFNKIKKIICLIIKKYKINKKYLIKLFKIINKLLLKMILIGMYQTCLLNCEKFLARILKSQLYINYNLKILFYFIFC